MASEPQERDAEMTPDPAAEDAMSRQRVSRRIALRAAAAGGAGAAVFFGPKIKDGTLVPAYAAAATCVGGETSKDFDSGPDECPGNKFCWGTFVEANPSCICADKTFADFSAGDFSLEQGSYGGQSQDGSGFVAFDVVGIVQDNQSCTVSVDVFCGDATEPTREDELVFLADDSGSFVLKCPSDTSGSFTLTLSCTCD